MSLLRKPDITMTPPSMLASHDCTHHKHQRIAIHEDGHHMTPLFTSACHEARENTTW
jgi:hypothetical protein